VALAACTGGASALVVQLPNGHRISLSPVRGGPRSSAAPAVPAAGTGKLEYHGGPIMPSNTNYALYWAPEGAPAYPAEYKAGLNTFFADLAHDSGGDQNVDSVATQYNDSAGAFAKYDSHFGGALTDTDPYPANGCVAAPICLTDAQIQAELKSYVKAHGLPQDLTHEYFVLTPPGVEDCFEKSSLECSAGTPNGVYCAYHDFINATGGPIIYANDPYVTGNAGCDDGEHPNNKPSDGALQGGLSHEHNESTTDPELNAWYDASGAENGDKCRTFNDTTEFGTSLGTAPDGSRYNQVINTRLYWYQQEWSNEGLQCKQRLAAGAPAVTKVAPKTGPVTGGTSVTITGTGFAGTTGVKFGAVAASKFTVNSSTSITATAPAERAGIVDVTVTTSAGTSEISLADRYKFAPVITSVKPTSGPAAGGTLVTVAGAGFIPGTSGTVFKFGATAGKNVSCASSQQCTVLSPKHEAGTVEVRATVNTVTSAKPSPATFKFL
jgi:IPT/TIG domain-containing protein